AGLRQLRCLDTRGAYSDRCRFRTSEVRSVDHAGVELRNPGHKQSSERICVEHANAELKAWRPLQRYLGNRDDFDETFLAIGGLVSDRAAER
ncbi:MAG: hypothetical protein ACRDN0_18555, partial [Trebonia sp.]